MISALARPEATNLTLKQIIEDVRNSARNLSDAVASGEDRTEFARNFFRTLEILACRMAMNAAKSERSHFLPADECDVPPDVWLMMYGQFTHLATGDIPGPIRDCEGRGVKEPAGVERRDIIVALAYISAAKAHKLSEMDNSPVKTIADLYGVNKRTVQGWANRFGSIDASALCAGQYDTLLSIAGTAAERYRAAGRSHAAVRARSSAEYGRM